MYGKTSFRRISSGLRAASASQLIPAGSLAVSRGGKLLLAGELALLPGDGVLRRLEVGLLLPIGGAQAFVLLRRQLVELAADLVDAIHVAHPCDRDAPARQGNEILGITHGEPPSELLLIRFKQTMPVTGAQKKP